VAGLAVKGTGGPEPADDHANVLANAGLPATMSNPLDMATIIDATDG
jgi:hypothetical protein